MICLWQANIFFHNQTNHVCFSHFLGHLAMPRFSQRALFWPQSAIKWKKEKKKKRGSTEEKMSTWMQSSQDQRADSRWEQMTTPTGHNSRDPGVPSTPERRRRRRRWLGCWSAKIKQDPIIGITTSQWAGELSYLENTKAFACTLNHIPQHMHAQKNAKVHRCYITAHTHFCFTVLQTHTQ